MFLLGLLQRNSIFQKDTCPLASFGYDSPLLCSLTVTWIFLNFTEHNNMQVTPHGGLCLMDILNMG